MSGMGTWASYARESAYQLIGGSVVDHDDGWDVGKIVMARDLGRSMACDLGLSVHDPLAPSK